MLDDWMAATKQQGGSFQAWAIRTLATTQCGEALFQ
jgi:hypothetical protein